MKLRKMLFGEIRTENTRAAGGDAAQDRGKNPAGGGRIFSVPSPFRNPSRWSWRVAPTAWPSWRGALTTGWCRQQISTYYPQAQIQEVEPEDDPLQLARWGAELGHDPPGLGSRICTTENLQGRGPAESRLGPPHRPAWGPLGTCAPENVWWRGSL